MGNPSQPAGGADPGSESAVRNPQPASKLAPLIVLSGPSGVGKTTLVDGLIDRKSLPLRRAITVTTRAARPGEVDEVSYHYWTAGQFREAIARGEMLEWAEVHGAGFYGTPRSEVDSYRAAGIGVILVIDVQGAGQVRLLYPGDHLSVFVNPPAFDELRRRLEGRGEPEASIRRRLETARGELTRADEFDTVLENAELGAATDALEKIIRDDFTRRGY